MILRAENISKRYFRRTGQANYFEAVKPLSLALETGSLTLLMGRSGGGKTTLLHMLSGLLTPTEGKVWLGDTDLYALPDAQLSRLRGEQIGVVPQGRSAVDTLTVLENVLLPGQLCGQPAKQETALYWLEALEIGNLADARPAALSGGELRRMAIARVLTQDSQVILADEPTGDLDDASTRLVLSILQKAAHEQGKTVFVVTHENDAREYADRVYRMVGGSLS